MRLSAYFNSLDVGTRPGIRMPRYQIAIVAFVLVVLVGAADFASSFEIPLVAFYMLPISLAAWSVGRSYALFLSVICNVLKLYDDYLTGPDPSSVLIPAWNFGVRTVFYICLVLVLYRLRNLQRNFETLAEERAVALTAEIAERESLEREMLAISEREQQRIGQDLHDGLCQHLTGTALTSQGLAEALAAQNAPQTAQARKIVDLVEDAISLARGIAKGLHPVELQTDGLMQALEEFTTTTSELFGIQCAFECHVPVLIHTPATATHLYRIAQEAVSNAIKHGRATHIVVSLEESDLGVKLTVCDNGAGLPDPLPKQSGMGLRIMADRARVIGGRFAVARREKPGAELSCLIPRAGLALGGNHG